MQISKAAAARQIERLSGLPYFSQLQPAALDELIKAMQIGTEEESTAAINALLSDVSRASSADTNRVPSPGELRAWIQSQQEKAKRYWESPPPPTHCRRCSGTGRVGRHDWKPDWSMTTEQIDAACEAAKVPCPDCQEITA